ncbi:MAG: alpha/beta fold hydrolase [Thermodesulfobacteriota bacterium]
MIDLTKIDYSELDVPAVLSLIFYPRPDFGPPGDTGLDLLIPVEAGIKVGARFHPAGRESPCILFFHGNGEIAADYDDLAPLFNRLEAGFLPVDYRGYGRSGGRPTVTGMIRDAHVILPWVRDWLNHEGYPGPLVVMGRSLGSASALELAHHYPDLVAGLIVESGFGRVEPLLALLGVDPGIIGKKSRLENTAKISAYTGPTLIIHAEYDHLLPLAHGQALFEAAGAADKTLLKIPGADHNDIFLKGMDEYLRAVSALLVKVKTRAG